MMVLVRVWTVLATMCVVVAVGGCAQTASSRTAASGDDDLAAQLAQARAELDACAQQREIFQNMADAVVERLPELQADAKSCRESMVAKDKKIADLQEQLVTTRNELARLDRKLDINEAQLASARRAGKAARARIADLERQVEGKSSPQSESSRPTDSSTYRPLPDWSD